MYKLNLVNIGRNIKAERVRKGYSQEELAELADTTRHTISLIESGLQHPKILSVLKIANALSLDINELLK
ncbi:MAG TPA: transcriptional regulator [Cyanobacteria bacterium UBA11991]|nr:helix-turn-helix transcriptional regulator [Cyanobacteriota bacterium]MDY6359531.1 helix-turn-helix transcriptional regulator [Cyanobacteriota bacterium]MDY6364078.1 helix-turn-helix transcriptional regulator [Cyanobacteriota bacterium]MDY6382941.1 helix-turn-helix transcriptional regulator [Cyanobacteriota bacterium]HCB11580.1 transcriptional regulator [Cyanobacteria bacterium UBA11991]